MGRSLERWREVHADLATWARVHFFRFWTATVVVIFFGLSFWYAPEFLTGWQRMVLTMIQGGSRMLPYPWGDRVQFIMINFGASIWLQFTLAIIVLRILGWSIGGLWRRRRRRRHRIAQRRVRSSGDLTYPNHDPEPELETTIGKQ